MQEMQVRFLGTEDPLEEEMAACSSILTWEIPWGHKELDTTEHACIQALVLYRRILIYAGCAKLLKSSAYFECT